MGGLSATYNNEGMIKDTIYNPEGSCWSKRRDSLLCGSRGLLLGLKGKGDKYLDGEIIKEKEKFEGLWSRNVDEKRKLNGWGKLLFFGRNQTWAQSNLRSDLPADFRFPDLKSLVPKILEVKS